MSENSYKQGLLETAQDCSVLLAEKLASQLVLKVDNYFKESVAEAELGQSKKLIFSTKREAQRCESAKHERPRDIDLGTCAHRRSSSGCSGTCSIRCHIDSQGKPWAWTTANARKKLGCCSMLKRSSRQDAVRFVTKKQLGGQGTLEKRDSTGALFWTEHVGSYSKRQPEHDQRTNTVSDSWNAHQKEGSEMTGEHLYHRMHTNFQREEPMYIKRQAGLWKEP